MIMIDGSKTCKSLAGVEVQRVYYVIERCSNSSSKVFNVRSDRLWEEEKEEVCNVKTFLSILLTTAFEDRVAKFKFQGTINLPFLFVF